VTIAFGLRNLPDLETGVRELVRVLRPDGILAVLEFTRGRTRWMEPLYGTWSRTAVPVLGRLLSWKSAYRYLPDSIEAYVTHEELARILKRAGALPVENHTFTGGVCTLVIGRRTDRDPT
jgi:demethylmenaquinone methyltransferase/2-methoxy-6-polyprenyl-1,4-benzoquinol methylase